MRITVISLLTPNPALCRQFSVKPLQIAIKLVSVKSLQIGTISGVEYALDKSKANGPTGQRGHKMPAAKKVSRKAEKPCPEFDRTREFIGRYSVLAPEELDIITTWAMGTWTFSPMCQWPATFPYLYVTGPAGSGKTVLGQDSLGSVCRQWASAAGATGPTLFRMLGREDEETGEIENYAPTLFMDEIDATFSGSKDEPLRLSLNVGYKRGATIPRAAGKTTIAFPVYGPKILGGIDNGHLPETVTQRSIRIEIEKRTQDELEAAGIQPFYTFDIEDESAEIQQMLSDWAKVHSMVLRDYRPAAPKGLTARQWEISRSLVQLAHAIGIENRVIKSLVTVFNRKRGQENAKQRLYMAVAELANETGASKLTTKMILAKLAEKGIGVPGNSGKGLSSVLKQDGITPRYLFIDKPDMPGYVEGKTTHRGYQRFQFDQAFVDFLPEEDDE